MALAEDTAEDRAGRAGLRDTTAAEGEEGLADREGEGEEEGSRADTTVGPGVGEEDSTRAAEGSEVSHSRRKVWLRVMR